MTAGATSRVFVRTAAAPITWGTTYYTTTEFLPAGRPLLVGALRALPAGVLILACVRVVPNRPTLARLALLSLFNIGAFFPLLFLAAYRLAGGAAAAFGAMQPLIVLSISVVALKQRDNPLRWAAAGVAAAGVALVVLRPTAHVNGVGVIAAAGAATSMACGVVLTRRWLTEIPALVATGWQLLFGGVTIAIAALTVEGRPPALDARNLVGFTYLTIVGTAVAYTIWFRGIQQIGAANASLLGLLSPLTATLVGWIALHQHLGRLQLAGYALTIVGIAVGARPTGRAPVPAAPDHEANSGLTGEPAATGR